MKRVSLFTSSMLVAFTMLVSCNNADRSKHSKGIAGTWRLVEFADFDSTANVGCIVTEKIQKAILPTHQVVY